MSIPKLYGVSYTGGVHKLRETSPSVKHQDVSRRAMFHAVYVGRGCFTQFMFHAVYVDVSRERCFTQFMSDLILLPMRCRIGSYEEKRFWKEY